MIRYFDAPMLSLVDPSPINQGISLDFNVVGVDLPEVNAYVVRLDGVAAASCSFVDDSTIACKLNGKQELVGEKVLTLEIEGIHFEESKLTVEVIDVEDASELAPSSDTVVEPPTQDEELSQEYVFFFLSL